MSEEEFSPIRPKSVPLSHVAPEAEQPRKSTRPLPWRQAVITVAALALVAFVFLVVPDFIEPMIIK